MMDIGHTKGPWVAEAADIFGDHNIVLADRSEDCRAVAAVVSNMRDPLEVEANARLIAAAPELLDALQDLLTASQPQHGFRHVFIGEAQAKAQSAISKATSRQPGGER